MGDGRVVRPSAVTPGERGALNFGAWPGVYLLPKSLLVDVPVSRNNRGTLITKPGVVELLNAARDIPSSPSLFARGVTVDSPRATTLVLWGYVLMTLYWTASWATTGRSIGARLMGVRVVNRKGEKVRWLVALARAAFSVGFPIGLGWALVSRRNRSVQDVVLRTIVIYDWTLRAPLVIGSSPHR